MNRRDCTFWWVIYHPGLETGKWTPAEYFNGRWFLTGVAKPVPERHLLVGEEIIRCLDVMDPEILLEYPAMGTA